jgi:hypothetical protein
LPERVVDFFIVAPTWIGKEVDPVSSETVRLKAEPVIRRLRTVLDETSGVLQAAGGEEEVLVLGEEVERLRRKAEALAPDYPGAPVQNGPADG